ncbi:MAG: histone deacetylase family protein [Chromatiales bacterium]|jgi:acetoin utilization deacetylase AcuC-like enzyme
MNLTLISHPDCLLHSMGPHHPESPARLYAIQDQLVASGLDILLQHVEAPLVTREQLLRVHDADYVDEVFNQQPDDGIIWLDAGDTGMNRHSLNAARHAAGAVVMGVDIVLSDELNKAFCNVRPPGHHATHDQAMGFCIFNNIAVGAAHALEQHGLQRVLIIDFDVHHGNGTEDIFRHDKRILLCSSFQHPFYPNTGADTHSDHIINMPLTSGTDGAAWRSAIETHWLDAIEVFRPELILISAGFDGHAEDDMANFRLVEADYRWLTSKLVDVADRHCQGRIVSSLEGGYQLSALGRSVAAHIDALIGKH